MSFRIDQWRKIRDMTQQDMAEKLGVQASQYARWENNPESIKISNAIKIADALGVKLDSIIFANETTKV